MNVHDHLRRLMAANDWANRELLAGLLAAESPPRRALEIFAHIIGAERLWLARLNLVNDKPAVWPAPAPEGFAEELLELQHGWEDLFGDFGQDGLGRHVRYTNSKGEEWSSTVEEILTHVALHSAYHRGQIAMELRAAGIVPAYTDFIHGARQGLFE
jgi:uncharacterized damage-inducible protein DinB